MISVQIRLTALKFGIAVAFVKNNMELWRNGGGTAATDVCRRIFFLPFLAELDNSESFETNFFLKKNPLVFAFYTCNFSKTKEFFLLKNKLHDLGPNKTYSSEIWHSSSFCEEQHGTMKKRRRNRCYRLNFFCHFSPN